MIVGALTYSALLVIESHYTRLNVQIILDQ